jgi:hypothetical protein
MSTIQAKTLTRFELFVPENGDDREIWWLKNNHLGIL